MVDDFHGFFGMLLKYVELHKVDNRQQRAVLIQADEIIQGKAVAELPEFLDAGDQHRRDWYGLEDFVNHVVRREQADEVAHQGGFVQIDEGELAVKQPVGSETEGVADDLDTGLQLTGDLGRDGSQRLPEQEFVGEQAMFGIDNGLPCEKGFLAHQALLERLVMWLSSGAYQFISFQR